MSEVWPEGRVLSRLCRKSGHHGRFSPGMGDVTWACSVNGGGGSGEEVGVDPDVEK